MTGDLQQFQTETRRYFVQTSETRFVPKTRGTLSLFVGYLKSQQHAGISQGRTYTIV